MATHQVFKAVEPEAGLSYPVVLGPTILGKRQSEEYCSLRYDFLPASAAKSGRGRLEVHSDSQVHLQLPSSSGSMPVQFSGRREVSKDGLDCVAIFDGTRFRLEVLQASVKGLRPVSIRKTSASRSRHGQDQHVVDFSTTIPVSESAAAASADESFALSAGSPPQPPVESDRSREMEEGSIAEDGLDDLEQALFEELNEDDGMKATRLEAEEAAVCHQACSDGDAEPIEVAGADPQAPQNQSQQPHPKHKTSSADNPMQCQPAFATNTAPAGTANEYGFPVAAESGHASAQPVPSLQAMSELDLEFFGGMVGSPDLPERSEKESSSEEESSEEEEI